MKKIIALAISLTMILSVFMVPAYADQQSSITNVVISSNASNSQITVQGNISTGSEKKVTIQVLDPNGSVDYIGQTISTEGGKFVFTFKSNNAIKGIYTAKIGGEGIAIPYEKNFEFSDAVVTSSEISNVTVDAISNTGKVTVQGNISTGSEKNVTIQVLDPNGKVDYIGQTISSEDGKFIFEFTTNNVLKGNYTVKIGGEEVKTIYEKTFEFSNSSTDEKPLTPTNLKAVAGINKIDLSWTAVTGVVGYNVYRSTTVDGEYTRINSAIATKASYSDKDLIANTTYYYKVTAVNAAGESDKSVQIAVAPIITKSQIKIEDVTTGSQIQIPQIISKGNGVIPIAADVVKALQEKQIKVNINIGEDVAFSMLAAVMNISDVTDVQNSTVQILKQSIARENTTTSSALNLIGNSYEFTITVVNSVTGETIKEIHDFNGQKVTVTIKLNSSDLVGVDTSRLKAYFFNTATNNWEAINGGVFNSQNLTFIFDTTHFTQFAVMEDKSTTPSNGGSSSSGSSSSDGSSTTATSKRLAGLNRIDTSIAIAKEQFSDKQPDAVVLTSGNDFPDALGGSGLAYKENAPILLVGKSVDDSKNVLDYITANLDKSKNIYVLGGTGAVSTQISDYLTTQGYNVIRLGGKDRYETNQKIVDKLNVAKGTPIVIANGNYFADALSISSIADMKGYPVLINGQDSLSANVIKDITNIQPTTVYVIGGTGVLSANIETQIKNLNGNTNIVRLGGKDRYETSMMIVDKFNLNTNTITVASGENFPDALSGSVLAARKNSNVLLINNSDVSKQKELLKKQGITNVIVLGGEGVVSKDTVDSLIQK